MASLYDLTRVVTLYVVIVHVCSRLSLVQSTRKTGVIVHTLAFYVLTFLRDPSFSLLYRSSTVYRVLRGVGESAGRWLSVDVEIVASRRKRIRRRHRYVCI